MRRLNSTRDFALRPCRLGPYPPSSAPTARFKRPTLLIVGCGDVGLRVARLLARPLARARADVAARARAPRCAPPASCRCSATSTAGHAGAPRRPGRRGAAPRAAAGARRGRPAHARTCCARWRAAPRVRRIVYASTSGVYGDCGGARIDETRRAAPARPTARGAASMPSARLRWYGRAVRRARQRCCAFPASMRRDRAGGDPRERCCAARRCSRPRTTSTPTTSMPTTWRAPASPRCIAGAPQRVGPRERRQRAEDGRLLRPRGRPVRAAAAAAHRARAGRGDAVADAAELHGRVAPARQPAAEARAAPALRYPTLDAAFGPRTSRPLDP